MATTPAKTRVSYEEMDQLRVRAIRGSKLADLTDSQREWVWRSLLKGIRRPETMALGEFSDAQYQRGVERVRRWYAARIASYKAQPKVVRPVKPLARSSRRGIGFLRRGGE